MDRTVGQVPNNERIPPLFTRSKGKPETRLKEVPSKFCWGHSSDFSHLLGYPEYSRNRKGNSKRKRRLPVWRGDRRLRSPGNRGNRKRGRTSVVHPDRCPEEEPTWDDRNLNVKEVSAKTKWVPFTLKYLVKKDERIFVSDRVPSPTLCVRLSVKSRGRLLSRLGRRPVPLRPMRFLVDASTFTCS